VDLADGHAGALGLTAAPASRQAMDMGEPDVPTIAEELPTLERESVEDWLRRPGGALDKVPADGVNPQRRR
jgi:hypothetical protein